MHDETKFSRYGRNDDIVTIDNEASPIFPKIGHPIMEKKRNKGKTFNLDHESLAKAHRYALFNFENKHAEEYIMQEVILSLKMIVFIFSFFLKQHVLYLFAYFHV